MKRIGMTWRIDPAWWEHYRDAHLNPPRAVVRAIQKAGMHNYSIFVLRCGADATTIRAFAYVEVDGGDVSESLDRLARDPAYSLWAQEVGPWVLSQADESVDDQFLELQQIFYCH